MATTYTLEQFLGLLSSAAAAVPGLTRRLLHAAGRSALEDVRYRFATATDPRGRPWPKRKWPRSDGQDGAPLLGGPGGKLARTYDYRVGADSVTVGTGDPVAAWHARGGVQNHPERTRERPWVFKGAGGESVFTRRIRAHRKVTPARNPLGWSGRVLEAFRSTVLSGALGLFGLRR